LLEGEYLEAKNLSDRIAAEVDQPRFYRERGNEVESSREFFESNDMVQAALRIVEDRADMFGHGLSHVRKVAVDAGAWVLIEAGENETAGDVERLMLLAHLAGVLHDIKRMEPEHAMRGAEEAEVILQEFELEDEERQAIVQAIRNHEAFKPAQPLEEPSLQVLSDALYDADKFRWGPDNFTETVWMMVAPMNVPLNSLLDYFLPSLDGIERIAGTFRTRTGREYGPDFIVRGLEIGQRLYQELARDIGRDE
jgi:HD superfamily phosphohydrolase YqeK